MGVGFLLCWGATLWHCYPVPFVLLMVLLAHTRAPRGAVVSSSPCTGSPAELCGPCLGPKGEAGWEPGLWSDSLPRQGEEAAFSVLWGRGALGDSHPQGLLFPSTWLQGCCAMPQRAQLCLLPAPCASPAFLSSLPFKVMLERKSLLLPSASLPLLQPSALPPAGSAAWSAVEHHSGPGCRPEGQCPGLGAPRQQGSTEQGSPAAPQPWPCAFLHLASDAAVPGA